ncbi:NAD(P)-binding protein [Plenodomus tracheiphilus IPT5]|uniref:NAD(P)-binding protein n=1 Tax=Plenodomus tracheiphilus IPT5 TaxID=1408161 RepID=A0A6A7AWR7_9PLEO|nr:NAD(P)-binding protein [Plenodomus tracheiphilus IPT5]
MVSKVIAVAGGSGKLGRAIVDEIASHGGYKVYILGREASAEKSKEYGAEILAVDYSNADSIAKVLESNNIDTVISTLGSMIGPDPELALIQAANKSNSTKRYIPSMWGIDYTPEVAKAFPVANAKIAFVSALDATSLEYTVVMNGFFLDYFGFPKVKSYLGMFPIVIDLANNAAAIPGSGNTSVVLTYSFDIGRFVAALLSESKWDKRSVVIGDRVTWNEFLQISESVKGTKFDVKYDDIATLQKGQPTELPGHQQMYPYVPKEILQNMCAVFGIWFDTGIFDFKTEGSLNEKYPEIKTKSVKAIVEEAWGTN